jgi:hypothetical protein
MPSLIPCALCGNVGFVRAERVITGDKITIEYHCGQCQRPWVLMLDERRKMPEGRPAPATERRKQPGPFGSGTA